MSAAKNKDVVQGIYQAFGSGDVQAVLEACADDVSWADHSPAASGIRCDVQGTEAVKGYFAKLPDAFDITKFEVEQLLADGDRVVAIIDMAFVAKSNGKSSEGTNVHVFTLRDGKVARWEGFASEDAAAYTS